MLDPVVLSALVDHDASLGILDELTIVRSSLEASMAAAAARRQTPERSEELRRRSSTTEKNIDDFEAYNDADAAFHYVVMEQSGIRLAANITRILFARARSSSRFTGSPGEDAMRITLDEHHAILDAIVARRRRGGVPRDERSHLARLGAPPPGRHPAPRLTAPPPLSRGARPRRAPATACPRARPASKPYWHGSVRDHHSCDTGSACIFA